jgi:uncharacterized small protein (DUF1192 family)
LETLGGRICELQAQNQYQKHEIERLKDQLKKFETESPAAEKIVQYGTR